MFMDSANSVLLRYRNLYQHEKDSNQKLLAMVASVPEENQADPRFQQAVNIAAHLVACRENWLDRMAAQGERQGPWFEAQASLADLSARYAAAETAWTEYLEHLTDSDLANPFDFPVSNGGRFTFYIEGQLLQLVGHGNYHRGQIALLVDQLGGEAVDTDYLYWTGSVDGTYRRVTDTR